MAQDLADNPQAVRLLYAVDEACAAAGLEWAVIPSQAVSLTLLVTHGDISFPTAATVHEALQFYAAEIASLRSEGLTRGLAGDVMERVFALGFSLEQMRQNLRDLERCVSYWADSPAIVPAKSNDEVS